MELEVRDVQSDEDGHEVEHKPAASAIMNQPHTSGEVAEWLKAAVC